METPRILVADDQSHILEALQLLLKHEGFACEAVRSPAAVVEAVQKRSFDVLLLDLNYARDTTSGAEGLELLSRIRQLDSALPVILMTAWASVDLAVRTMQTGGGDFIQKPWDNAKLLLSVRRQIEEGRRRREGKRENEDARAIQRRLLPAERLQLSGWDIQSFWQPANNVGGDYFDALSLTDSTAAFCIADVAGKGMPAALVMANMQANVRSLAHRVSGPAEMCRQLNWIALESARSDRLTTFFYGILDSARPSIRYSNAGHVPPIRIRADGAAERLSEGGLVLGAFPDAEYEEAEIVLRRGDRLIFVTDGITEASSVPARDDAYADEFGAERLIRLLLEHRQLAAADLQRVVLDAVAAFAGPTLHDDAALTIVSMQ